MWWITYSTLIIACENAGHKVEAERIYREASALGMWPRSHKFLELHGLPAAVARLAVMFDLEETSKWPRKINTGSGRHSEDGIPVLDLMIPDMIQSMGYTVAKRDGLWEVRPAAIGSRSQKKTIGNAFSCKCFLLLHHQSHAVFQ